MSEFADTDNGYEPTGGWGYHEWEAAGNEAWHNYSEASAAGDTTAAGHWEEVAQNSQQNADSVYAGGGSAYGSGGDASGFNDGSYYGVGSAAAGAGSDHAPMDYSAYGGSDSASMIDSAATDITSVL